MDECSELTLFEFVRILDDTMTFAFAFSLSMISHDKYKKAN